MRYVNWIETTVSQFRSVNSRIASSADSKTQQKLTNVDRRSFVLALMQKTEVPVLGTSNSAIGQRIVELFRNDVRIVNEQEQDRKRRERFPPCLLKEYIFRWIVPRPAAYSRPTPQRMQVLVNLDEEFRVSGAFTEDTTLV